MTVAQARALLVAALGQKALSLKEAIQLVRYYQQRNYAAYQSHRKRTQRKYRQWVAASRKKRKVSL